ncbi:MAG: AraC family transcriptional regulator ligand-binding domain-containing protein [Fluviicoccus sp.]|uniref:AraC family transcriptional regulator n=1 Tax=Fluviicoccus sp. TaxID=2003552 RepID=UPI00272071D2|nr:AraC family transcriptional regulator [Fluviicoccus sp.]MDO8331135.1 AraC family transcriptional regulator ligand-binding domain-containing protein [Fluviicoccus sp.]
MNRSHARPTIFGAYVSSLAAVVARWDISAERLLEGSGIDPERLLDPLWQVDYGVFVALVNRALQLTGEPGLGFHLGLQMTVTCHGLIGFAAMVCRNVREALEVAQQYILLQSSVLAIRLVVEGDTARLYFEQDWPNPMQQEVACCSLMLGFAMMGKAVTGLSLVGTAEVPFAEPAYFSRFAHLLPGDVRFGQKKPCMVFPASYLDFPLLMADPLAARLAREQCKNNLRALVGQTGFSHAVRELLHDEVLGFAPIDHVAEKLHMSVRNMQRQLAAEGLTFRQLLAEERLKQAVFLLRRRDLSLAFIASRLGYANVTAFTRAFQRWMGETPGLYRQRLT